MDTFRTIWLQDTLSDNTRKTRRSLLFVCVISYLLVTGELLPEKIDILGIDFGQLQQDTLLRTLLFIVVYYEMKFFISSNIDGELKTTRAFSVFLGVSPDEKWADFSEKMGKGIWNSRHQIGWYGIALLFCRAAIEALLPNLIALYTIVILIGAL